MKTSVLLSVFLSGESFAILTEIHMQRLLKNAQEVLELLVESSLENGEPLPTPRTLGQSFQVA